MQPLMDVADPVAFLAAAARSGAVVAATVWGREEECDIRVLGEALAPWLGQRPPSGPSITEPARLRAVTGQAGLDVERVDQVVCPSTTPTRTSCSTRRSAGRPAERRADRPAGRSVRAAGAGSPCGGGYRLENVFRVLVARRNAEAAPSGSLPRACTG
ncbi:hypothetical protein [Blastococcus brunescens]|uniref:Uncharacterized protein n=1 Tax=Blastococcus brunescens TaxID=1564165 RepID=A0ABZ1ATE1_9ACTN|nr:hypothetical protein [Blastococcus sp. BMG 8361]WRL61845.1 hypothetical protein U6N30_17150 [Blastococcus sp. BMG 8361]